MMKRRKTERYVILREKFHISGLLQCGTVSNFTLVARRDLSCCVALWLSYKGRNPAPSWITVLICCAGLQSVGARQYINRQSQCRDDREFMVRNGM